MNNWSVEVHSLKSNCALAAFKNLSSQDAYDLFDRYASSCECADDKHVCIETILLLDGKIEKSSTGS